MPKVKESSKLGLDEFRFRTILGLSSFPQEGHTPTLQPPATRCISDGEAIATKEVIAMAIFPRLEWRPVISAFGAKLMVLPCESFSWISSIGGIGVNGLCGRFQRQGSAHLKLLVFGALVVSSLATSLTTRAAEIDVRKESELLVKGRLPEQVAAMKSLAGAGKNGATALCDVLEFAPDAAARSRAVTALQKNLQRPENRDSALLDRLDRMMNQNGGNIAGTVSMAVMHFKGEARARAILKEAAKSHPSEQIRAQILGAFMVNADGDKSQIGWLANFLKDRSEFVQVAAAGYLGSLGDSRGLALCAEILERDPADDRTRMLQMRAAIAAGRIGNPKLASVLKKVSESGRYGLAQSQARSALWEIDLHQLTGKAQKIAYLKDSMAKEESARWSVQQLMAIGDSDAQAALSWAAVQKNFAGTNEARNALAALAERKSL